MTPRRLRIWAIVQARMSSQRLPGKVLAPINGQPMIGHLLDRLDRSEGIDGLCVATSESISDEPIVAFCRSRGTPCYRGNLDNVAVRVLGAAEAHDADAFVRISGDSPLLDPRLVTRAAELFRASLPDLVSNVVVRTFPKGQSVEVVNTSTMRAALPGFRDADEAEHVTLHFYRNREDFRIVSFAHNNDVSHVQLSVDTEDDLSRMRDLVARFERPAWSYDLDEVLQMRKDHAL
jgi:spore coat polysaccharide biosynthesis protein SpsF